MAYRYHPEIEGLKINEDGTEIIYCGDVLQVSDHNRSDRESDLKYVYFNKVTHSVAKLICECWNGMAENPRWCATRKTKEGGFHYSNLEWQPCGFRPKAVRDKAKRSKLSNLSDDDVKVIEARIQKGDTLKAIAKDYGTSDMSISRIKKRMKTKK